MNCSASIKRIYQDNGNSLPALIFYPIIYLDSDGGILCANCATEAITDDFMARIVSYETYWEGPSTLCDVCNAEIESAYGEVDDNG